ncbi:hypothetical protein Tco_1212332 [Tanacetum coccineum]
MVLFCVLSPFTAAEIQAVEKEREGKDIYAGRLFFNQQFEAFTISNFEGLEKDRQKGYMMERRRENSLYHFKKLEQRDESEVVADKWMMGLGTAVKTSAKNIHENMVDRGIFDSGVRGHMDRQQLRASCKRQVRKIDHCATYRAMDSFLVPTSVEMHYIMQISLAILPFWAEKQLVLLAISCNNTLSVLGKFDGKSDEGFLVGYSLNSKAYRVYNLVTKRVEVNLHVNFLEDKPNVKGVGYIWMFDINYLSDSMNYIPVSLENQANPHAGASEVTNNAGTPTSIASEEKDEEVELIVVPSTVRIPEEKDKSRTSSTNSKKEDNSNDSLEDNSKIQAFRRDLDEVALKHLGTVPENNTTSTSSVNTGSQTVNTGRLDHDDSLICINWFKRTRFMV